MCGLITQHPSLPAQQLPSFAVQQSTHLPLLDASLLAFAQPGPSLPPILTPPPVPHWNSGSFVAGRNLPILPCKVRRGDTGVCTRQVGFLRQKVNQGTVCYILAVIITKLGLCLAAAAAAMGRKPVPQPLTLTDALRPDEDPRVGETVPKDAPSDATSPRSPRFRFGQKKAEGASGVQVLQVTEVLQQQQQRQQQQQEIREPTNLPDDLHPPTLTSPTRLSHRRDQSPSQRSRRHQRQDESKSSKSGFFHFGKSTKSTDRLNTCPSADARGEIMSRDSDHPTLSKQSTKQSGTA